MIVFHFFFCSVSNWVSYSASWLAVGARKTDTRATPASCHELWWLWRQVSHVGTSVTDYTTWGPDRWKAVRKKTQGRSSGKKNESTARKKPSHQICRNSAPQHDENRELSFNFSCFFSRPPRILAPTTRPRSSTPRPCAPPAIPCHTTLMQRW